MNTTQRKNALPSGSDTCRYDAATSTDDASAALTAHAQQRLCVSTYRVGRSAPAGAVSTHRGRLGSTACSAAKMPPRVVLRSLLPCESQKGFAAAPQSPPTQPEHSVAPRRDLGLVKTIGNFSWPFPRPARHPQQRIYINSTSGLTPLTPLSSSLPIQATHAARTPPPPPTAALTCMHAQKEPAPGRRPCLRGAPS